MILQHITINFLYLLIMYTVYLCLSFSLPLSLSLYIYIYIYIEREREREKDEGNMLIPFKCSLHICSIPDKSRGIDISFFSLWPINWLMSPVITVFLNPCANRQAYWHIPLKLVCIHTHTHTHTYTHTHTHIHTHMKMYKSRER